MNCEHTRTMTCNSRPYGHKKTVNAPFPYLVYRRKKCLDCGERFNTYEVTQEAIRADNAAWMDKHKALVQELRKLVVESGL